MSFNAKLFIVGLALPLALSASALSAQDDSDPATEEVSPIDPMAAKVVLNSTRYLAAQQSFTFSYFLTSDEVVDGREKITYVTSGAVEMARGEGFLIKSERGNTLRDYYFNGKQFTISSPDEQFFATVPFSGSYEELVERVRDNTGLTLPVWTLLAEDLPDRLVEGVESAAYLGTTLIAGRPAHHVAFSSRDEDWQIWISTDEDRPFPLMLVGTRTDLQGWPQFRVNFMDWEPAPQLSSSDFAFVPEGGEMQITMPWVITEAADDSEPQEMTGVGGQAK